MIEGPVAFLKSLTIRQGLFAWPPEYYSNIISLLRLVLYEVQGHPYLLLFLAHDYQQYLCHDFTSCLHLAIFLAIDRLSGSEQELPDEE